MGELLIVVDNFPHVEYLERDWGFSALLTEENITLLFDLGAKEDVFAHNVEKLGIDLSSVDCLVISHSDYDHVGGLRLFLERNEKAKVFVPDGFDERLLRKIEDTGHEIVITHDFTDVCGPFKSTGPVKPSPRPEHSLFFKTKNGYWIVAGCSHPGVSNIVEHVKRFVEEDVDLYIGGFHFYKFFGEELKELVLEVKRTGIKRVAPCHCSGHEARMEFERAFGENFVRVGVGTRLSFEL